MPDFVLVGADALTVHDSKRAPISVERGGVISTTDKNLVRNLASDSRFAPSESAAPKTVVESFTTEPPKKRGRPPKNAVDALEAEGI